MRRGLALVGAVLLSALVSRAEERKASTPAEVFTGMVKVFQAEKSKGLHIRYLFQLGEPEGGDWWITVDDGKCQLGKGAITKPDCTIVCTGSDWVMLDNKTLSGVRAYLTGRLKIVGDRGLAQKLNDLFP